MSFYWRTWRKVFWKPNWIPSQLLVYFHTLSIKDSNRFLKYDFPVIKPYWLFIFYPPALYTSSNFGYSFSLFSWYRNQTYWFMLIKNIPNSPPSIPAPNCRVHTCTPQKAIEQFPILTMLELKYRYCQVLAISKFIFIMPFLVGDFTNLSHLQCCYRYGWPFVLPLPPCCALVLTLTGLCRGQETCLGRKQTLSPLQNQLALPNRVADQSV